MDHSRTVGFERQGKKSDRTQSMGTKLMNLQKIITWFCIKWNLDTTLHYGMPRTECIVKATIGFELALGVFGGGD